MTPEQAQALREPFPDTKVGKLPRIWCVQCRDAPRKVCDQHKKSKCRECQNNITDAHLHLDYVGHADVTDRLLEVDPAWTWEPLAYGPDGLPALDRFGGMWMKLTVAGVTRLGYGDAGGKNGPDAVKEAIGDGLRNAGMRFGVALDLWSKSREEEGRDPAGYRRPPRQTASPEQAPQEPTEAQVVLVQRFIDEIKVASLNGLEAIAGEVRRAVNQKTILPRQRQQVLDHWERRKAELVDALTEATEPVPAEPTEGEGQ